MHSYVRRHRGQTALFDAVLAGLEHLQDGQRQKKVLVVFSDGGDNASKARFSDVQDAALRMNALIYSITLHHPYDRGANPGFCDLRRDVSYVVRETRIVSPTDLSVLEATPHPTLTLITCYPFDYVGSAPQRFIVRAEAAF